MSCNKIIKCISHTPQITSMSVHEMNPVQISQERIVTSIKNKSHENIYELTKLRNLMSEHELRFSIFSILLCAMLR